MNNHLFYPMFAMFVLTFVVAIQMFRTRIQAVKDGKIKMSYFYLYNQENLPEKMVQASRHFTNLFETPVLFYVVCILGLLFSQGYVFVVLAWLYVAVRVIHAFIHLGSNRINLRFRIYALSWVILWCMWGLILWNQLGASPI